ncbi:MAG: cytochrome c3 family protein [Phycisphaerales bacterium JB039]
MAGRPARRESGHGGRRGAALIVPMLVLTAGWVAWPISRDPPTTRVRNCTESGCHAETMDHEFLHGPTAVGACTMCHTYDDPAEHTFSMKTQEPELCTFCHIDVGKGGNIVHQPVAEGQCLSCHDPHGASNRQLVPHETMAGLCAECHVDTLAGEHIHPPAATGECSTCHSAHAADHAGLLAMPRRDLCMSCHEGVANDLANSLHVHDPAAGDCLDCHTTHASDQPGQLLMQVERLCLTCHEPVGALARAAEHKHSAVFDDRACLNCHLPHASESSALQHDDPVGACMACHGAEPSTEPSAAEDRQASPAAPYFPDRQPPRAIAAKHVAPPASELIAGLPNLHGPVADGDCAACHGVHGAEHSRLLKLSYAESFYVPFSQEAYALCFTCHDQRQILETPTTVTKFRDGTANLHALHVNREQGRSCRSCHNTHASKSKAQVRETAQFGQWELPLNFTLTETGGSCSPGCHKPAAYDRVAPVGSLAPEPVAGPEAPSDNAGGRP